MKCYIDYAGSLYMVTWCGRIIYLYLVTKYKIFRNIPFLKNLKKYEQLNIDDSPWPDHVDDSHSMFNHLDKESATYYIDMARVVVEAAVRMNRKKL